MGQNFTGMHFGARGYYVTTVGADEETIANYIMNQEDEGKCVQQLTFLTGLSIGLCKWFFGLLQNRHSVFKNYAELIQC